jgi:hypothetical protein
VVVDGRLLDDVLEAVGSGKGDPALYTGLLHLLSFPFGLHRWQAAIFRLCSRQREIDCMGRCISKRKSPSRYPYSGLGLAHSTCLDLNLPGISVFSGKYQKAPAMARKSQLAEFAFAEGHSRVFQMRQVVSCPV